MVSINAYSIWKSYNDQKGIDEGERVSISPKEIGTRETEVPETEARETPAGEMTSDDRDNQRVKDLSEISLALDEYAKFSKNGYPVTVGYEKISDENSYIYRLLRQDGYLKRSYHDPLSGAYFYGYGSDGKSYELTAAFEDMNDVRCKIFGTLCVYILKKP